MAESVTDVGLTDLVQRALPLWGMSGARFELVKVRENAVFRITNHDGSQYALRVHRAGYHSDAALRSEFAWMRALNESGIRTPRVAEAIGGALFKHVASRLIPEVRQVDVLEWIDAPPLGSIEDGFADSSEVACTFRTIGSLTGRMHNHAETWARPSGFTRESFDLDGLTGATPRWGRFWECGLLDGESRQLARVCRERLRSDLQAFGNGADRYGLIHADLLPENLLGSGDEIHLIDFDDGGFGWHLFDLATTLFFHLGEDYFDAAVDSLVAAYRENRPLTDAHMARLPMFLAARGTTYLGWLHSRPDAEEVRTIGPDVAAATLELMETYLQSPPIAPER